MAVHPSLHGLVPSVSLATGHDAPTDETVAFQWDAPPAEAPQRIPHLVIAWFLDEPERTGQVVRIDRRAFLGRPSAAEDTGELLRFHTERPGSSRPAQALSSTAVSRRQLDFEPLPDGRVRVQCVGRRSLFHNGAHVTECVVEAGDTLTLELTAVFLVDARPVALPALRHHPDPRFPFGHPDPHGLVGETPVAWKLREELAAAAASPAHVLLLGGSGAGKELAATVIHRLSPRSAGPFVARNAATLPESLLDAELFGSARNYPNQGAPERPGLIGAAHGGILFLDEIGELPEAHHAHLLRVVDAGGEYHRLGESQARRSDLRLVAATNRGADALKPDFLARFTHRIQIPGLSARRADIPFLIRELVARGVSAVPALGAKFCDGDPRRPRLDPSLVESLVRHDYAFHTRELERLLAVALSTSPTNYIAATPEFLSELRIVESEGAAVPTGERESEFGRERIARVLSEVDGKVMVAAERLGVSRHALRRLMQKHGIVAGR
jgi:DNA-binding NtrC family response regulator